MRSKTSFFNRGIDRKSLTRYWPVWAAFLALWLLLLPTALTARRLYAEESGRWYDGVVTGFAGAPAVLIVFFFALFAAMAVWSYLFSPRAAAFYHALPVRRRTLFFTQYLTGLAFLAGPACLTALVTWVTELAIGCADGGRAVLVWLGAVLLLSLFFFSLATLCAFLTGHAVALPALYLLLNFAVVVIEYLVRVALTRFLPSVEVGSLCFAAMSPPAWLLSNSLSCGGTCYAGFPYLGWLAFAAAVLTVCALLLYERRHTESAGDVIAVPFLRPVFRVGAALGCAVVLGSGFFALLGGEQSRPLYVGCLLCGGLIGYLAAEMLLCKRFRVLRGCWKRLLPALCAVLALACMIAFDLCGAEKWTPAPGEVRSVTLEDSVFQAPDDISRVIALHHLALSENRRGGGNEASIEIAYRLRDGRSVRRWYRIGRAAADAGDPQTALGLCVEILNAPEAVLSRVLPRQADALSGITVCGSGGAERVLRPDDWDGLLAPVRAEAEAGRLGRWPQPETDTWQLRTEYRAGGRYGSRCVCFGSGAAQVIAFLKNNGYWES